MSRSGQLGSESARTSETTGSGRSAPRPGGGSSLETKVALGLVGLAVMGRVLTSRSFYAGLAVAAIAVSALRQIGQQNQANMADRLAAWNRREMQRLERKAQHQARTVQGAARMARSGQPGAWPGLTAPADDRGPGGG
jgi:hypothetical protein